MILKLKILLLFVLFVFVKSKPEVNNDDTDADTSQRGYQNLQPDFPIGQFDTNPGVYQPIPSEFAAVPVNMGGYQPIPSDFATVPVNMGGYQPFQPELPIGQFDTNPGGYQSFQPDPIGQFDANTGSFQPFQPDFPTGQVNKGGYQSFQNTDVTPGTETGSQEPNGPVFKNYVYQLPNGKYVNLPLISDNKASPPIVLIINPGSANCDIASNGCAPKVPTSASINGGGIGR